MTTVCTAFWMLFSTSLWLSHGVTLRLCASLVVCACGARRAVKILRFSDMIVVGELGGLSLSDSTRGKILFNRATLDDDRSWYAVQMMPSVR